jgi:hypothetical protein
VAPAGVAALGGIVPSDAPPSVEPR